MAGHAAVLGMVFGSGTQFPFVYRNGIFIANHGSRFDANATAPVTATATTSSSRRSPTAAPPARTGFDAVMRPLPEAALQRPVASR